MVSNKHPHECKLDWLNTVVQLSQGPMDPPCGCTAFSSSDYREIEWVVCPMRTENWDGNVLEQFLHFESFGPEKTIS